MGGEEETSKILINTKLGWAEGKHQKVSRNIEADWVFPPNTNP